MGKSKAKAKRKDPPPESDPLRRFYVSLFKQKPNSQMAIRWLCENGLGHIVIDLEPLRVAADPSGDDSSGPSAAIFPFFRAFPAENLIVLYEQEQYSYDLNMPKAKKAEAAVAEIAAKTETLKIAESKPTSKKSAVVRDSSEEREAAPRESPVKKSPRKKSDPGVPKRTRKPSEYNLFIGEQIRRIGEENKEVHVTERMKMAQKLWREKKASSGEAVA